MDRIEAEFDALRPSLRERLARLEQAAEAAKGAASPASTAGSGIAASLKRFSSWMGAELPKFLAAAVLLWITWGIKDSVDLSIKQRTLDLSYASELQGLLQTMSDPNSDSVMLESTAVVLASYGEAALPSLIRELRHTGVRANAAVVGISSLALTNPEPVCAALPRVLANRAHQYDWQAHLKVVRLLGENSCTDALVSLQVYEQIVVSASQGNTAAFEEIVSVLPAAPADTYPRLVEAIEKSLRMLEQP